MNRGVVQASGTSSSLWISRVATWILIVLAVAIFVVRGPIRYLRIPSEWNDFSQNYTASKLWIGGQSPADPKNFVALWKQQSHSRLDLTDIRTHLAPPLGGLVVMAPVAALPWRVAKILWLLISLLSFGVTVSALVAMQRLHWNDSATMIFVAACFAFAPFHTGIANGNTSIMVIALCILAIWAASKNSDIVAGLCFGLACSIKPQMGAFLVLYYLVRQRWRLSMIAVACTAFLNIFAAVYLHLRGTSWVQDYINNARGFVTSNNIDSFTSENPGRFSLINLQVPFFSFTGHSASANLLAFGITGLLVGVWVVSILRSKQTEELLSLGAVSAMALLPVYHRFYDAGLLAIPLVWCIGQVVGHPKSTARWGLLFITPFLFPGSAVLERFATHGSLPNSLTDSWLWPGVILPHENWALLLLSIVLLWGIINRPAADALSVH